MCANKWEGGIQQESISSTFCLQIFRTNIVLAAYIYVEEAAKTTFVRKICT